MEATPDHIRWTLAVPCKLRSWEEYANPSRTERHLRAVRAFSDARHEGRICDGIVFANHQSEIRQPIGEVLAFRADAAFEPFSGQDEVESTCATCPANLVGNATHTRMAGCFGLIAMPMPIDPWLETFAQFVDESVKGPRIEWRELWADGSSADSQRISSLASLLRQFLSWLPMAFRVKERATFDGLEQFCAAADVSLSESMPLVFLCFPEGQVEGRNWTTAPCCSRCSAPWPGPPQGICSHCKVGRHVPEQRRKLVGKRPYRRLLEFMSEADALSLLEKYRKRNANDRDCSGP